MRRRDAVFGLGAAAASPLAARAQPAAKLPTIGLLSPNSAAVAGPWAKVFVDRLRELGWVEGTSVAIAYRWGEGRTEGAVERIAELIRMPVDIIVTHGPSNIAAAQQATSKIPIVFPVATDPVGSGFVASLARPGGNMTGLSIQSADLGGKRLELLREILPGLRRLAVLGDPSAAALEIREVLLAADALGVEIVSAEIEQAADIGPAFASVKDRADALYVCATPLVNTNRAEINALALAARLPTMHGFREAVEAGALISYGANFPDLFRRTADYVDKILRGAKPGDIPVEQPTKFDLVVNLKTAQALGLAIPPALLARADEVIE